MTNKYVNAWYPLVSYPEDSYPGQDVSYALSISSYPTLWSIRTQKIMTQNV